MPAIHRVGDLQIDQSLPLQRRFWAVQRPVWIIWGLILLAALLGLLGPGPLSSTTATSTDRTLRVTYNRFDRYIAQTQLRINLAPSAIRSGRLDLFVQQRFLDYYQVQFIVPQPNSTSFDADRITYHFTAASPSDMIVITFYLQTQQFGTAEGSLGIAGGPSVRLKQVIYP